MSLPASNEIDAHYAVGESRVFASVSIGDPPGPGLPPMVVATHRTKRKSARPRPW